MLFDEGLPYGASIADPMRMTTYKPDSATPIDYGKKRLGGLKQQWTEAVCMTGNFASSQNQDSALDNMAFTKLVHQFHRTTVIDFK